MCSCIVPLCIRGRSSSCIGKKMNVFFMEIKESLMLLMYTGKRSGPKNGTLGDSRCDRCWCWYCKSTSFTYSEVPNISVSQIRVSLRKNEKVDKMLIRNSVSWKNPKFTSMNFNEVLSVALLKALEKPTKIESFWLCSFRQLKKSGKVVIICDSQLRFSTIRKLYSFHVMEVS